MKSPVIKIPCQLEGFKFRKANQDWIIEFSVQPEQLDFAKPLMKLMNESFAIVCVNIKSIDELNESLQVKETRKNRNGKA